MTSGSLYVERFDDMDEFLKTVNIVEDFHGTDVFAEVYDLTSFPGCHGCGCKYPSLLDLEGVDVDMSTGRASLVPYAHGCIDAYLWDVRDDDNSFDFYQMIEALSGAQTDDYGTACCNGTFSKPYYVDCRDRTVGMTVFIVLLSVANVILVAVCCSEAKG